MMKSGPVLDFPPITFVVVLDRVHIGGGRWVLLSLSVQQAHVSRLLQMKRTGWISWSLSMNMWIICCFDWKFIMTDQFAKIYLDWKVLKGVGALPIVYRPTSCLYMDVWLWLTKVKTDRSALGFINCCLYDEEEIKNYGNLNELRWVTLIFQTL